MSRHIWKLPRLPEMAQDRQFQTRFSFAPRAIAVARRHMKPIIPRRQKAVKSRPPGPRFNPIIIQPLEAIAETQALGRVET